jgi:serine/threonine-protein kinase RsbW
MPHDRTAPGSGAANGGSVGRRAVELRYEAVPADAEQLRALRHALAAWADRIGMDAEQSYAVVLASYEALANAVIHAYSRDTGTIDLHAVYRPEPGRAEVTVTDRGRWQPMAGVLSPLHGRGLPLMRHLAETVDVAQSDEGTTVRLSWTHAHPSLTR